MMRFLTVGSCLALLAGCCVSPEANKFVGAVSPDGRNEVRLWLHPLAYEVLRDGIVVVGKTEVGLQLEDRKLDACQPIRTESRRISGILPTPVYKKSSVDMSGIETFADCGDWGVRLMARNDGVAYRFETMMPGRIKVVGERAGLRIPNENAPCTFYYGSHLGCEEKLPLSAKADEIVTGADAARQHVYLPFVYSVRGKHVAVTESDVWDYPVWNLKRVSSGDVRFDAVFAGWPKKTRRTVTAGTGSWFDRKTVQTGGRWVAVDEYEDWLVETEGTRNFPWRVFVLGDAPSAFCSADIVHALARGQVKYDFSWVKPGKVAWDWWNDWNNKGVKTGCDTATYRQFVDFSASNGIEYVILDEGWSETLNIWRFNANVDVPEIIRYGREKGVGIILWMAWAQVFGDEKRVANHFAQLGASGFKVDFMDRGDAECERFLWKFADECAKVRMIIDYHGVHRPAGMGRAYPNVLNFEGVHGLENAKWYKNEFDFMDNDVKQFFLRMTAGPLDYTPGAMDNYAVGRYVGTVMNPGSVGTRCRQMAMMALYEAPLQMLCDSPMKYERERECFSFMARVPVVWDDTIGLGGTPDTYAAIARRKGDVWYVAAINNAEAREVDADLSFLGNGEWCAEIFRDAPNSGEHPMNYEHVRDAILKGAGSMVLRMAAGGGFIARLAPCD